MNYIQSFAKKYFIDAMTGMALGLFVTLIAGLIMIQIGKWAGLPFLISVGKLNTTLMGAGIGAGVALYLKAPPLVVLTSLVSGLMGAHSGEFINGNYFVQHGVIASPGNPIAAYLTAVVGYRIGLLASGKTSFDILLVPISVMLSAYMVSLWICPPVVEWVNTIGEFIKYATHLQPFVMGILIAVTVGVLLTMPTSSAAICIAIGLDGIAGGAAVVGCAAQMIGFATMSYKENGFGGFIAQGLGTSMLQIPNIFKNPILLFPPIIASAITGPMATTLFHLKCSAAGSGMGTAGLVGVFGVIDASNMSVFMLTLSIALLMFIMPAIISLAICNFMRKQGWIKHGDLALPK